MAAVKIEVGSIKVYPTATGIKVGSTKAKVLHPYDALSFIPKADRRAVRKALTRAGYAGHAARSVIG